MVRIHARRQKRRDAWVKPKHKNSGDPHNGRRPDWHWIILYRVAGRLPRVAWRSTADSENRPAAWEVRDLRLPLILKQNEKENGRENQRIRNNQDFGRR